MTRRRALRALALACVAGVVAAGIVLADDPADERATPSGSAMRQSTGAEPTRADGEPAPPLAGENPITGKRVDLAAFRGKPVVLNAHGRASGDGRSSCAAPPKARRTRYTRARERLNARESVRVTAN